ncbi:MAG: response regulator [Pseudomonadota bacterium]
MGLSKPIFIIDDDRRDRDMIERAITACHPDVRTKTFGVLEDSYGPILHERPACIILDDYIGHLNALDTLQFLSKLSMRGRIIVVSSSCMNKRRSALIGAGCADYLEKDKVAEDPSILGQAIQAVVDWQIKRTQKAAEPTIFDTLPELRNLPPLGRRATA